eukprot:10565135-Karenia_brevis.AAC.1
MASKDPNMAIVLWYDTAREELADLAGRNLEHRPPHFRWAPAVRTSASKHFGDSKLSRMWRVLAQRADHVIRIVSKGDAASTEVATLRSHATATFTGHHRLAKTERFQEATK